MDGRVGGCARVHRVLAVTAVLALGLSGCSSGSKADDAKDAGINRETTTSQDGVRSTTTSPASKPKPKVTTTTTTVDSSVSTSTPTLPSDPSKPTLALAAELAESCVRPGGSQAITIRTEPDSGVGYDAVYADGKSGLTEGHYGGNKAGQVDDEGTWSDTWVVAPNAPAGRVEVRVLGAKLGYNAGQTTVYFTVSDVTGKCD